MTTMTDRELLELAAKAVGIEYEWHHGCGEALHLTGPKAKTLFWNPLTDDGDALRLAVKLNLVLSPSTISIMAWAPQQVDRDSIWEKLGQNPENAWRRAIVRAAAEIGKAMP